MNGRTRHVEQPLLLLTIYSETTLLSAFKKGVCDLVSELWTMKIPSKYILINPYLELIMEQE